MSESTIQVGHFSVILGTRVVSSPAGSLCLNLPFFFFSSLLGLYLFFKLVACTSSSDWHVLLLGSRSPPMLQQGKRLGGPEE